MRFSRRRPLLVSALLCALVVLAARPTAAEDDGEDPGISARVARLYEDASVATRQYEAGRREAEAQRTKARRAERLLARERQEVAARHEDLGRIAREQYRQGGGLPYTAQILIAGGPDDLIRGQRAVWRADLDVSNAVTKSRRAEARLAADEARARSEWQAVEHRNGEFAEMKRIIQAKLEEARSTLQSQADASVAAGSCRGAVRLEQPKTKSKRAWVAPVRTYVLSAGFGRAGKHWASRHTGQDFAVPIGTPVRAVGTGRVVSVSCRGAFGIEIVIEHPGGYCTRYAHLAAVAVDQGERVSTGQWIGQSGTSGNSTGPHLHFEVRVTPDPGSAIDPVPWLAEHGVDIQRTAGAGAR
ncbi:peptidase [Streptomyces albiflavescens]|uniref:Peptidase n=1 Tax=Streptomyces albiflavescens TaxID=1623582 RepID=A0A917Y4I4_9ACTN|nr:M23 family metallopeptidase [Streptomyces albiflavescens]GGN66559.1 peptidase [Streptomyces albiflavescens]